MDERQTFDAVAPLYDARRPGYPAALFDDLCQLGRLRIGDAVLEVGCGTGQATDGLVSAGYEVTATDPGERLIAVAQERFAGAPNVRFEIGAFEAWDAGTRRFDMIASAQAWHWVPAEISYAKAASLLRRDGHLAVFGHTPTWPPDLVEILEPIYRRHATWGPPPEAWYLPEGPVPGLFAASGMFAAVEHRAYRWSRHDSREGFVAYLKTRSDHIVLPAKVQAKLFGAMATALPAEVETHWQTHLYVGRVIAGAA